MVAMVLYNLAVVVGVLSIYLTSAAGLLLAPDGQRGVQAGERGVPLQVMSHVALEMSRSSRMQILY